MTFSATSPILLFSYGTLQDKAVQRATFGRELTGWPDAIMGYAQSLVAIDDPEVIATSGKTHHPIVRASTDPNDEIPGTVFEITAEELAAADEYEVSDYQRVSVPLRHPLAVAAQPVRHIHCPARSPGEPGPPRALPRRDVAPRPQAGPDLVQADRAAAGGRSPDGVILAPGNGS
jgi:hypothetical protein